MPNVTASGDDDYMCTSLEVKDDSIYIVGADPKMNLGLVHHVNVFGCGNPGHLDPNNRYSSNAIRL